MSVEEAIDTQLAVAILDRMRAELKQLPERELLQQNVDSVTAIIKARRSLAKLAKLKPVIQQLPLFNLDNLERLEDFAMAFVGAQTQHEALRECNKEPAAVVADGIALRNQR
jgi:hypothetical protein